LPLHREEEEEEEEKARAPTIFTIINRRCSSHLRILIGIDFLFLFDFFPFALSSSLLTLLAS
jgi:hypothetical protein